MEMELQRHMIQLDYMKQIHIGTPQLFNGLLCLAYLRTSFSILHTVFFSTFNLKRSLSLCTSHLSIIRNLVCRRKHSHTGAHLQHDEHQQTGLLGVKSDYGLHTCHEKALVRKNNLTTKVLGRPPPMSSSATSSETSSTSQSPVPFSRSFL
ncbi:hypothetical protein YC2023_091843 [Brassica napus]